MDDYLETELVWEGLVIELRYCRSWLDSDHSHIELRCDEPLPITETGYRSIFSPQNAFDDFEEVTAHIWQELNEAARSKAWQDHVERSRQGTLF